MTKYETRIMTREDAKAFLQNMQWFAGFGRITAKETDDGRVRVRATRAAWSNWVESK